MIFEFCVNLWAEKKMSERTKTDFENEKTSIDYNDDNVIIM